MVYLFMFFYEGRERINGQIGLLVFKAPNRLDELKEKKSELTNKSSEKDDLNVNGPITLLNSVLFFLVCLEP
jgi:hypothetical protein